MRTQKVTRSHKMTSWKNLHICSFTVICCISNCVIWRRKFSVWVYRKRMIDYYLCLIQRSCIWSQHHKELTYLQIFFLFSWMQTKWSSSVEDLGNRHKGQLVDGITYFYKYHQEENFNWLVTGNNRDQWLGVGNNGDQWFLFIKRKKTLVYYAKGLWRLLLPGLSLLYPFC